MDPQTVKTKLKQLLEFSPEKNWKSDLVTSQLVTILTLPEATAVPTVYSHEIIVMCITSRWSIAAKKKYKKKSILRLINQSVKFHIII